MFIVITLQEVGLDDKGPSVVHKLKMKGINMHLTEG